MLTEHFVDNLISIIQLRMRN